MRRVVQTDNQTSLMQCILTLCVHKSTWLCTKRCACCVEWFAWCIAVQCYQPNCSFSRNYSNDIGGQPKWLTRGFPGRNFSPPQGSYILTREITLCETTRQIWAKFWLTFLSDICCGNVCEHLENEAHVPYGGLPRRRMSLK